MNKSVKYFGVTWLVSMILFHLITFLIPAELRGVNRFDAPVFWVAYAFILVGLLGQLAIFCVFSLKKSGEKLFLSLPLLRVALFATPVTAVVGAAFMVIPVVPAWIGAIVCLLITAGFAVAAVKGATVAEAVLDTGAKTDAATSFLRDAVAVCVGILARSKGDIRADVKGVCDALRYSDAVSSPALSRIESDIQRHLDTLEDAVLSEDDLRAKDECDELSVLIRERNTQCAMTKK